MASRPQFVSRRSQSWRPQGRRSCSLGYPHSGEERASLGPRWSWVASLPATPRQGGALYVTVVELVAGEFMTTTIWEPMSKCHRRASARLPVLSTLGQM